MRRIEIEASGHVDRRDSAFPTLVRLDNGDIICGYSVGGGPNATGGTDFSRSTDEGMSWSHQGTILGASSSPKTANNLRLSRTPEGTMLAYGQRDHRREDDKPFEEHNEPVLCRCTDGGGSWSVAEVIPSLVGGPFEISNPIVVASDGRWLAPAATLPSQEKLFERAVVFESSDQGRSWSGFHTVFEDPDQRVGFLEQKLIKLDGDRILAVAWIMPFGNGPDEENRFAISDDGGRSWSESYSTGIMGQTMTPIWLGDDRLLVLYNRRYGQQGVQMCLVRFGTTGWDLEYEGTLWDAQSSRQRAGDADGVDEMLVFAFGYPWALSLGGDRFLSVHWCKEEGKCGIRWTRLRITV